MTARGYRPAPFFALRTPLLPFEELEALFAGVAATAATGDPAGLEEAVTRDLADQRRRLQHLVARPEVREALFLASPDLDDALGVWIADPASERGQRIERALVRYVTRMTSRATPFGLFAASSVGRLGGTTRLTVEGRGSCRRHSRLDMDFLFALTEALGRDPAVRGVSKWRVNSSLYSDADRVRYVETRVVGRERTRHLVAVEDSPHLQRVLAGARDGATVEELSAFVVDEEVGREDAVGFVGELIDAQVLVPHLPLPLTGLDPLAPHLDVLAAQAATRSVATILGEAAAELAEIDGVGLGIEPGRYRRIASRLSKLPEKPELSRLFHVDLVRQSPEAVLGERVLIEARRGVDLLHRMMPPRSPALRAFCEAFEERFGRREVPLVQALDEESGIGFPAWVGEESGDEPLLRGVRFPVAERAAIRWAGREEHLLGLLAAALSAGESEIVLTDRDVEALSLPDRPPMPEAFAAFVRVAAPSFEALDRGEFRLLCEAANGPSGAHFLGRFCHADPDLRRLVGEHLKTEEALDPESVFAEIVHLPDGRSGNLLSRPALRDHEIPFLGDSGLPADRQIPVTDLTLRIGAGGIELRSLRLGRRVVPRLTSAQNYVVSGLGLYRFLCSLQAQGTSGGAVWDWGALATAPFLPRVAYGRIVLATARWHVSHDELEPFGRLRGAARFAEVAAWRARRRLPRRFYCVDGGAELLVDLDSVLSVEAWLQLVRGHDSVELKEMFPSADALCVHGGEGRYVHEILIPFTLEPSPRPAEEGAPVAIAAQPAEALQVRVRRSCPPGSEWLSVKFYGGSVTLDRLLRERLGEAVRSIVAAGLADRWFFVRYGDPRTHLRLRLHGEPRRLWEECWPRLAAVVEVPFGSGQVWKVQIDTYDREIERYGGPEGIDLAERIFHVDSEAVLELQEMLEPGDEGEEERWRLAFVGADRLLADLGLSAEEKLALAEKQRRVYGREHREDPALRRSLAESFRRRREELVGLLGGAQEFPASLAPGLEILERRSEGFLEVTRELQRFERQGRLAVSRAALAARFVHMYLNRLWTSRHRRQELVLWDALACHYRALRKRRRAEAGL